MRCFSYERDPSLVPLWAQEVRNLIFEMSATCSHLPRQPLAATWQTLAPVAAKWLQVADGASGCKWLPSGFKWLQVAASG